MRLTLILILIPALLLAQNPKAPIYPGIATDKDLGVQVNRFQTVLTADLSPTDTTIQVASTTGLVGYTYIGIDLEFMMVCQVVDATHVQVGKATCPSIDGRGMDGTLAAAHAAGATRAVAAYLVAGQFNQLAAEVKAMQATPPGVSAAGPTHAIQVHDASGGLAGYPNLTNDGTEVYINSVSSYPTWGDPNDRTAWSVSVYQDAWLSQTNPTFSDNNGFQWNLIFQNGFYTYSSLTRNKSTSFNQLFAQISPGAAQAFTIGLMMNKPGVGDSGLLSGQLICRGNPVAGDEATCSVHPVMRIQQDPYHARDTVNSVVRSACPAMTIPAGVTDNVLPQTVTVSPNTTGCVDGDWEVVNQSVPQGDGSIDSIQIISHTATTLTAVFSNNEAANVTLTPALVITTDGAPQFGQLMPVINMTAPSYSAGTVAWAPGISVAAFTGTGTSWSNTMVGGSALNPGAFSPTPDDDPAPPFSDADPNKDWYQIIQVASATQLSIYSFSVASDVSYKGTCVTGCAYIIRPAARVLRRSGGTLILETSTAPWNVGDTIESPLGPFPDVSGMQFQPQFYSKGGTYRCWWCVTNSGHRRFQTGMIITSGMVNTTGTDYPWAWDTGVIVDHAHTGLIVGQTRDAAMLIGAAGNQSSTINSNIKWQSGLVGGLEIGPHGNTLTPEGMVLQTGVGGSGVNPGLVMFGNNLSFGNNLGVSANIYPQMRFGGSIMAAGAYNGQPLWLGIASLNETDVNSQEQWRMEADFSGSRYWKYHYIQGDPAAGGFELFPFGVTLTGPSIPSNSTATATVNYPSNQLEFLGNMMHAGVPRYVGAYLGIEPEAGGPDTIYDFLVQMYNPSNSFPWPNGAVQPLRVNAKGVLTLGYFDNFYSLPVDNRWTLNPSAATAHRTVTVPDASGTLALSGASQDVSFGAVNASKGVVLPTACTGLAAGSLYNNAGTAAFCP